jgi:YidC/Oxa1 family membrane protein insertase
VKPPRLDRHWLGPVLLLVVVGLVLAACVPASAPGASGSASATPLPTPLVPAQPGADPVSLLAWLFTPIFQALFILLVGLDQLTGNIAIAIVLMTLIIRTLLIPMFRSQTVSQRRMQLVQPELREIQKRYKGDRAKISEAQMALYKERGVNPAAGCLPLVLQFILLIPMYSVIQNGLTNYDPSAMLNVFGVQLFDLDCSPVPIVNPVTGIVEPCINTVAFGIDWSQPSVLFPLPLIGGLSMIAVLSAFLQLIQSRMVMPPVTKGSQDQAANVQRQTMLLFPLISIFYGGFLPAGLFLYWIVTTIFSIVQQYLIVGWGSLFPIFGWTPGFAVGHTPRFPVAVPAPDPNARPSSSMAARTITSTERAAKAASTVRPRERGRQGRRGRRR